jgi:sarcosine oxidase subunit delta
MLLIHCPYCGEDRPELEFRHAGEAHIARPETITETSDADFEAFLYLRSNPRGSSTSAGATCMAAAASSTRCATR